MNEQAGRGSTQPRLSVGPDMTRNPTVTPFPRRGPKSPPSADLDTPTRQNERGIWKTEQPAAKKRLWNAQASAEDADVPESGGHVSITTQICIIKLIFVSTEKM